MLTQWFHPTQRMGWEWRVGCGGGVVFDSQHLNLED